MHDSPLPPSAAAALPTFQPLGAVAVSTDHSDGLTVRCASGTVGLTFLADGILRVQLAPGGTLPETFSYALDETQAWGGPDAFERIDGEAHVALRTGAMEVRMDRSTGCVGVFSLDGRPLLEDTEAPYWTGARLTLVKRLRSGERILGLGDKTAELDRRGGRYEHWNTDAFEFMRGTDPIYKTIPFALGITAGEKPLAYGLFVDTPARSTFDVGAADPDRLRIEAETETLTYYVFHAATPLEIVQQFTRLTGPMPMLPKWALGYHQSRYSYASEEEVRAVARGFRERGIPCDALYFDIHYMDGFRVFTWDRNAFPDPEGLIRDLKAQGYCTVVIVDPGVKADDPDYAVAQDGLTHDAFCRTPDGELYSGMVWPGLCYFPDFTDADVRRWWGGWHRALLDSGVDGVWDDMNEPARFNENGEGADIEEDAMTFPDEVRHAYEGRGADHAFVHNAYGMQMARATYEGIKALRPERRPFVITRAAYAGTQRYATGWTGDNSSTWDHLRLALQQCLSLSVSGMAFVGADVGGFIGSPSGELVARWTQLGALTPLFRNHSGLDTPRQEPWAFGSDIERVCREAIELRYRLLPYLYTSLHQAASEGLPMMRALGLVHPDDPFIRAESPAGFYVGENLLAYPVLYGGQREVEAYLPEHEGGWYDFHTGTHYIGGTTQRLSVELGTLPLFVRAGTVLPLGSVRSSTSEPVDTLTLRVYPVKGDFEAVLYDDAGDGWGHLEGEYRHITFTGTMDDGGLKIRVNADGKYTPEWTRWHVEIVGHPRPVRAVLAEGEAVPVEADEVRVAFEIRPGVSFLLEF